MASLLQLHVLRLFSAFMKESCQNSVYEINTDLRILPDFVSDVMWIIKMEISGKILIFHPQYYSLIILIFFYDLSNNVTTVLFFSQIDLAARLDGIGNIASPFVNLLTLLCG